MDADPLLAVGDLHAGYGETEVLHGVDLMVSAGEIVAVLGSNGVGKSTLNRTISGVLRATKAPFSSQGMQSSRKSRRESFRADLFTCLKGAAFFPT